MGNHVASQTEENTILNKFFNYCTPVPTLTTATLIVCS